MILEDYFEFIAADEIRIKGHRIGIEDVVNYYLQGYSPEQIQSELPSLSLEKIYATITYYLHNRVEIDTYMLRLQQWREQEYQKWAAEPSSLIEHLRQIQKEREQSLLNPV
ncbi:DUF433 domain-containing protein [Alkalinema pantanalense CENA528]|uniref:DUF433 domain-containing protein n=1 Tax=Alkalinema pantanalense TaxID=1620705 RepID=UPI003D6F9EF9